jgi:O-antigen/teichoic acid export membrane protein
LISFKVLFSTALSIFVIGVLLRDYLIEIIATKDYLIPSPIFTSSHAFLVVFSVVIFYFISLIFIYTLIASHHQAKLLRINIWVTLFNLIGNILLIPYLSFI